MITNGTLRHYYLIIFTVIFIIVLLYLLSGANSPKSIELLEAAEWGPTLRLTPLKSDYRTKLFNLTFKYLITPKPCADFNILAIIIVTSHYNNVETRSAMRRAFSQEELAKMGLQRVFLLGEVPDSAYIHQAAILDESKRFGDIIQGTFIEAYRNLTYKHIMGLKWVSEYCNAAQYVVKMDDDIVINVERVAKLLGKISLPSSTIAGYTLRGMVPIREPANKWYVTREEYQGPKYPAFVSGWFYVTTPRVASKLVLLSHYFSYFWIDDVYVTGILARNLKIKHFDLNKYFTVYPEFLQCCIADVRKRLDCEVLVGPNGGDNNLFFEFNKAMKICASNQCDERDKPLNETCVAERKISLGKGDGVVESYKLH